MSGQPGQVNQTDFTVALARWPLNNGPISYEVGLLLGGGAVGRWATKFRGSAAAGPVAKADNHRADNGPSLRKTASGEASAGIVVRRKSFLRR